MGVFTVEVTLKRWRNAPLLEDEPTQEVVCDALVDTGAVHLCLPADIVERLGLVQVGRRSLRTADGRQQPFRVMGIVDVEVQGRDCQVRAIELPAGATPLLGAIPLEDMDWHVSPSDRKLVPNPLSPNGEPISLA